MRLAARLLATAGALALAIHPAYAVPSGSTPAIRPGGPVDANTVLQAGAGAVRGTLSQLVSGEDYYDWQFGVVLNTATAAAAQNNCTQINAALAAIASLGQQATLHLSQGAQYTSCPYDNHSDVLVKGASRYGTKVVAFGSGFAGAVLKHRTVYSGASAVENLGGGFEDIFVDDGGVAAGLLEIDSESRGIYHLAGRATAPFVAGTSNPGAFYVHSCSDTVGLAVCDTLFQDIDLDFNTAATTQPTFWIDGSNTSDWSGNMKVVLNGTFSTGPLLHMARADNNKIWLGAFRNPIGSATPAQAVTLDGIGPNNLGAYANEFLRLGINVADGPPPVIIANGTDTSGVTAGVNNVIDQLDASNGTPSPQAGVGSHWDFKWVGPSGTLIGSYFDWGGTVGPSGIAPFIISNGGNEGLEISPGYALYGSTANAITQRYYNRSTTAPGYIVDKRDAASYEWDLSGAAIAFLNDIYSTFRVLNPSRTSSEGWELSVGVNPVGSGGVAGAVTQRYYDRKNSVYDKSIHDAAEHDFCIQGAATPANCPRVTPAQRFEAPLHTPVSSSEACAIGEFADDTSYHYVCVAANTWKRVALSSF